MTTDIACGGDPTDPVVAIFGDGSKAAIDYMTIETYKHSKIQKTKGVGLAPLRNHPEKKASKSAAENIWSGHSKGDCIPLRIAWRKDREPNPWLLSLYLKKAQVCSVAPGAIEGIHGVDVDAEDACAKIMVAVGVACQNGHIPELKDGDGLDFYGFRNRAAKKLGYNIVAKKKKDPPIKRRPAAAAATSKRRPASEAEAPVACADEPKTPQKKPAAEADDSDDADGSASEDQSASDNVADDDLNKMQGKPIVDMTFASEFQWDSV